MLFPIFLQKMYSNETGWWSIDGQYSIEFAPILATGTFIVLSKVKKASFQNIFAVLSVLLCIFTTIYTMDNTKCWRDHSRIRFYQSMHYKSDYNIKEMYTLFDKIPQKASVSATSSFTPHLALRKNIYAFPIINDADYILISKVEGSYPYPLEEIIENAENLRNDKNWVLIIETNQAYLYHRISR